MSDKPIAVGDLVMVVKPSCCCQSTTAIGKILTVLGATILPYGHCQGCGKIFRTGTFGPEVKLSNGYSYELLRLKRLDPGNLSEDVPTKEELHA